jgi:hypothetical protein
MQRDQHFSPRPIRTSRVMARPVATYSDQGLLASWLIAIALIATALLGLLFPLGPSTSSWTLAARPLLFSNTVVPNRDAEGDRLYGDQTMNPGGEPARSEWQPVQGSDGKIPLGCDAAFSRLVKIGNFADRCVA